MPASGDPRLSEDFQDALVYTVQVHRGQQRKGSGTPYVGHLLSVAGLVLAHGADEDVAMAALLHDAAGDQGGKERLADIRDRFGDRVAGIVAECSDTFETPKPPWHERKQAYLDHLHHASEDAPLVSAADKLHNARAILEDHREQGEDLWEIFTTESASDQLWYYESLVEAFQTADKVPAMGEDYHRLVDELENVVSTIHDPVDASPEGSA